MENSRPSFEHRATARILEIIEQIANSERGLTLTELSVRLDASKSSLHPILHTLQKHKYLSRNADNNRYSLGLQLFKVGQLYLEHIDIIETVRREMNILTKECGETCFFGVLDQGYSHYLVKVDSPEPIRMIASAGKQLPAYSTGLGKAMLSGCSSEELREMYPNGLAPITEHTIQDFSELEAQLSRIREEGFAYECEESTRQIRCIAVPIRSYGKIIAALSVATPIFRYNEEKEQVIKQSLLDSRQAIEDAVALIPSTNNIWGL